MKSLPIKWTYDAEGRVTGYERYNEADIIAAKEAELLAMYTELQSMKAGQQ